MNTRQLLITFALVCLTPLAALAQLGSVQVRVDATNKKSHETVKSTKKRTTTEQIKLKISLRNFKAVERTGLKVLWQVIADNHESDGLEVANSDTHTVDLPSAGTLDVETRESSLQHSSAYMSKVGARFERAPKQGRRYAGYNVQVFEGEQLVAEVFEPRDLKQALAAQKKPAAE